MRGLPSIDYADAKKIIDLIVKKAAQMSAAIVRVRRVLLMRV